jgi:glycosyltransferase involved in cell wall biosynthesis
VTVAIPTYQRPELLKRALACVVAQDYPNIELIVGDNATTGEAVAEVVAAVRERFGKLVLIRHPRNIGAYANFFSLLDAAQGEYFMWLADDDEVSPNYVSSLVGLLQVEPGAASAAGHWRRMDDEKTGEVRRTAYYPERSRLHRVLRFAWRADDAFFYGMHRTAVLRKASFPGYWWPNRNVLLNWGYPFLLDLVLHGPVLIPADTTVEFVNHDYIPKSYALNHARRGGTFQYVIRRVNVHYLYVLKTVKAAGVLMGVAVALVSITALVREFLAVLCAPILSRLRR